MINPDAPDPNYRPSLAERNRRLMDAIARSKMPPGPKERKLIRLRR